MRWIKIFNSEQEAVNTIPEGSSRLIIIGEIKVCLSNYKNTFKASENSCPHLGEQLHKGMINYLGEIICPWHNYRFDLTTGEESARRCRDLKLYPTKASEEGVFIGIP
jgi:3-phenylpropionate/trans-cinnamate dioxygenase ferredoxin subunit